MVIVRGLALAATLTGYNLTITAITTMQPAILVSVGTSRVAPRPALAPGSGITSGAGIAGRGRLSCCSPPVTGCGMEELTSAALVTFVPEEEPADSLGNWNNYTISPVVMIVLTIDP